MADLYARLTRLEMLLKKYDLAEIDARLKSLEEDMADDEDEEDEEDEEE